MLCSDGVVQILPAKPILSKMNLVLIVLATALPSVKISFAVLYRKRRFPEISSVSHSCLLRKANFCSGIVK